MKKVTIQAWIKTVWLLIIHRFNTRKALEETDGELKEVVCEDIIKTAYEGNEIKN
jgi:hypothetical protein